MIDTKKTIEKYKTGKRQVIRTIIGDNPGEIIGDTVDEGNKLYYVIRRGKDITVEPAENQPVSVSRLKPLTRPVITVKSQ